LKGVLQVPYEKREFKKYLNRWYKYINKVLEKENKKEEKSVIVSILESTRLLLHKADKEESYGKKVILPKTLKEYLRISFQYAFKYIIAEGDINEDVLKNIEMGIIYNDNLRLPTQRKYKRLVNLFIKNQTTFNTLNKIQSAIHINRSIIFKNEIDILIERLLDLDTKDLRRKTSSNAILMYQRVVFIILLYYTGARKNELRTRLVKDMTVIGKNTFSLDINLKGIGEQKLVEYNKGGGLKSTATKRRIRFQIDDDRHLKIIKRYLQGIEKKKCKFLFPGIQSKNKPIKIYQKKLMTESYIDDLGKHLQGITNRYTPLHSLRHSYVTNKIKYMLDGEINRVETIFELSNQIGHGSPEVTIEWYAHLGILKLMI
ncbi:MAG: hypothetical protein DRQ78_09175, partial [Epsilonproteobacteria bacterium]